MSYRRINQKYIVIWLDHQSNRSKSYADIQHDLHPVMKTLKTFHNSDTCIDFILNMKNTKIIFIISDVLSKEIVPVIHSCEQIDSIYMFGTNKITQKYNKIKGFYNDYKVLSKKIKENILENRNDSLSISLISSDDINSHDINRQDPSFMYFQLLKDIILNDHKQEDEEQTKTDMLSYCRKIYADYQETLNILDEFEKNFIPELAIYWYTRECFLYKMLNKALWTLEPDVLYKLRYFIRHLHQQILSQAALQRENFSSTITVYRGQSMSKDEVEKLKRNVGGFLSFNNFLSTSIRPEIAMNFLWESEIGVLFEMKIDSSVEKFPFANIDHLSYQQGREGESELLFSMGTVFRIVNISQEENFYRIQLKLSSDIDEQMATYTMLTREETRSSYSFLSLLKLMNVLGQYHSVDRFAEMLNNDRSLPKDPIGLGSIYHAFGVIYTDRGQSKQALDYFSKSLSLYSDIIPINHPKLSPSYNNIGSAHAAQSNYETALEFHQLALDCQLNSDKPDISSVVTYTLNIAGIYLKQEKVNEALEYYKRALDLQTKHSGENDPSLTNIYNIIGAIYHKQHNYKQATFFQEKTAALERSISQSDPTTSANCSLTAGTVSLSHGLYEEALNHFHRARQIQQQYFLPNNPILSVTYNCIANTYFKLNQYEEALQYHRKALEIELNSLSNAHPSIAISYSNISKDYTGLSQWSNALQNALKAIEQIKKSPNPDPSNLISYIQHVAHIYHQQKNNQQALNYYQRALDIQQKYCPLNDSSLVSIYDQIGTIHHQQNQIEQAIIYYKKSLEIERKSSSNNSAAIATSYFNISKAYVDLVRWSDALEYSLKGLQQIKKSSQTDANAIAALTQYVGHIYHQQNEYEQALVYYKEALQLYRTYLSDDDNSLLQLYYRIASVCYKLKKYKEALPFYQKALNIELKTLPDNAKTIADTYSNISTTYLGLNQLDDAFIAADKGLEQLSKTLPNNHPEIVQQREYLDAIKIKQLLDDKNN